MENFESQRSEVKNCYCTLKVHGVLSLEQHILESDGNLKQRLARNRRDRVLSIYGRYRTVLLIHFTE